MVAKTMFDKIWEAHLVKEVEGQPSLLYIDLHLVHEVTSPQAFEGLKLANRKPWRISANIATPDHNVPTTNREEGLDGISDEVAKLQVTTLDDNCKEYLTNIKWKNGFECVKCNFADHILSS